MSRSSALTRAAFAARHGERAAVDAEAAGARWAPALPKWWSEELRNTADGLAYGDSSTSTWLRGTTDLHWLARSHNRRVRLERKIQRYLSGELTGEGLYDEIKEILDAND